MGKGDSKTGQSWSNRYLVMRHGHSEANGQGIIVSTPEIGCSRYGLTGRGREQVAATLEGWSLPKPDRIFSSDFLRALSHRLLVMYQGKVVEAGEAADVFDRPQHQYTRTLMQAALG